MRCASICPLRTSSHPTTQLFCFRFSSLLRDWEVGTLGGLPRDTDDDYTRPINAPRHSTQRSRVYRWLMSTLYPYQHLHIIYCAGRGGMAVFGSRSTRSLCLIDACVHAACKLKNQQNNNNLHPVVRRALACTFSICWRGRARGPRGERPLGIPCSRT